MSTRVEWVPYGRPALDALAAEVARAKGDDPLAPFTVVVPSNHLGVATRRRLAAGGCGPVRGRPGLVAATFLTVHRLAELLGATRLAAAGRRPLSTPVVAAALRRALARQPGVFADVAGHPSTEAALVAAYRELRDLTNPALEAVARTSPRAADVVRLQRAARRHLEGAWYDEVDLLVAAADEVAAGSADAALGTVVVHLPQRLGHHAAHLLRALTRRLPLVVVAGLTGERPADAEVAAAVARITGDEPTGDSRAGAAPGPDRPLPPVVEPGRTRVLTASDADDEVRAAVRRVVDAARQGTPLGDIAILHASPEPYGRLVHEQLAAAGIPASGAAVLPLAQRLAGRLLLQLLALPKGGFRRRDVLAWLAGAPLVVGGAEIPVAAWERLSREAAVVAGRQQWDELLAAAAGRLDALAAAAAGQPDGDARAAGARADAGHTRSLRTFVLELVDDLAAAAARPRPWSEHAAWALRTLGARLGEPERRQSWPAAERLAAERVERAVTRLGGMDSVEGPVALDVFARTLELELASDLGRTGRLGEGVLVGPVGLGVGLQLELVIVVGLAEGSFPRPRRDDSLLPDAERAAAGGELALRQQEVGSQHRQLLASLAGAHQHVLCLPRGDLRRSTERAPSRWLCDLAGVLVGRRLSSGDLLGSRDDWVEHTASFDAGLRRADFPATEQEYRLRALLAGPGRPGEPAPPPLAVAEPALERGLEVLAARRSARFTRFDGNLAGLAVPSPVSSPTSATRLERWAECPFAYLLGDVLGVQPVEDPDDQLRITPIDRGELVHRALELFLLEVLARPPLDQPGPDDRWTVADHRRLRAIAEALCDDVAARGRSGRAIFWRRDRSRILADLDRFLLEDDERRAELRSRPVGAELAFGTRTAALGPVALRLDDGRLVHFTGRADRVDVAADGTLHVVDYKSGRHERYRGLSEDDPDLGGRCLQLAVYAQAARAQRGTPDAPVRADYWFVSAAGGFKRLGYRVDDRVLGHVGGTLATIVAGIESGAFPARPTAVATSPRVDCAYCDPDALGVSELRRAWERKRNDPALARYAALAEPPTDAEGDRSAAEPAVEAASCPPPAARAPGRHHG